MVNQCLGCGGEMPEGGQVCKGCLSATVTILSMAIDSRKAKRLDENGLARCGCGGVAEECGAVDSSKWRYKCSACGIKTPSQPNNAWAQKDWNTAMGVKDNG